MLRIAIVEDDQACSDQICAYLEQFQRDYQIPVAKTVYQDGEDVLERFRSQFDIILMDVQMKFVDGISAARQIRGLDEKVIIIFVTSAGQYAIRGYEVGAFDYILKPVGYFPFSQSLLKASRKVKAASQEHMVFKIKSGMRRVAIDEICYIESFRHNLTIHTVEGDFDAYGTIKELESQLLPYHFLRGNSGYLIHLAHVSSVQDNAVTVSGDELGLSRNRREAFMKALINYWGNV